MGDVQLGSTSSSEFGGGNTLRIGRPEHPGFNFPGRRASHLLDLFHAGRPLSGNAQDAAGPVQAVEGHVNLNTASREAIRLLVAGRIHQDPQIREFASNVHAQGILRHPTVTELDEVPDFTEIATRIADAIIAGRPYASPSEIASITDDLDGPDNPVFGNPQILANYSSSGFPR